MTVVAWLASVAAVLTSLSIIWTKAVRPVIKWAVRLDRTMTFVEQQMIPNGGTSLRDSINRIEARLVTVEEFLTTPK